MFTIAQVEQENLESTQVQLVVLMLRAFLIFGWRVDYNPTKGIYINIWYYSQGKGPGKAVKQFIPFKGNEKSFETILKQLNR